MYGPGGDEARNPSAMNVGRKTMARAVTTAVAIRMARAHASGVLPLPFEELRESPHSRASPLAALPVFVRAYAAGNLCNRAQVSAYRYLRRNGVPYSENAVVTEYLDRVTEFGNDYLIVHTTVDDPRYLNQPVITCTHFKREPDASQFAPCRARRGGP